MARKILLPLFTFFVLAASPGFSQNVRVALETNFTGQDSQYGMNGEYLDVEELCVYLRGNTLNDAPFETDLKFRIERVLSENNKYEVDGGYFVNKLDFQKTALRVTCLSESGTYRLTVYQQYGNAAMVNDYTEFPVKVEDFVVNIKGKPQEKVLTNSWGGNYFETATLYLNEIKDGTPKDTYDWTFKLKDGVARINFVVRMNEPLKLSEIRAVLTRYDSKVSAKGVRVENEQEYKRLSFSVPSRDWNAVSEISQLKMRTITFWIFLRRTISLLSGWNFK